MNINDKVKNDSMNDKEKDVKNIERQINRM